MTVCAVLNCASGLNVASTSAEVIFHNLPSNPGLADAWMKACGNDTKVDGRSGLMVCSNHFSSDCYHSNIRPTLRKQSLKKTLKPGAVPNINLPKIVFENRKEKPKVGLPEQGLESQENKAEQTELKLVKQEETPKLEVHNQPVVNQKNQEEAVKPKKRRAARARRSMVPVRINMRNAVKKSAQKIRCDLINRMQHDPNNIRDKVAFMLQLRVSFKQNGGSSAKPTGTNQGARSSEVVPQMVLPEGSAGTSADGLNKMHVMENVREACDVQPSSPGHAGQAEETMEVVKSQTKENGFSEEASQNNGEPGNSRVEDSHDFEDKAVENGSPSCDDLIEKESEVENGVNHLNEDTFSNDSSATENNKHPKRKSENEESSAVKKMKSDIHESFVMRDRMLNEYIELADCTTLEQLHVYNDQVVAEIRALNELAKEKEKEWNNIIHLRKLKEELLLRIQRQKQILLLLNDKSDMSDPDNSESQFEVLEERLKNATSNQSILKTNLVNPKNAGLRIPSVDRNCLNKLNIAQRNTNNLEANEYRNARQRNVVDVQSIIADYRQRHPETVPRRGRRIRSAQNENSSRTGKDGVLNFSSLALGSGSQVRQNLTNNFEINNELNMLLNAMDNAKDSSKTNALTNETSFREMLVHIAKLSQSERHELINAVKPPPPYPEVTVHPVVSPTAQPQSNSLLHGILTKPPAKPNSKTSFSPTLARLLTAPEREAAAASSHLSHANNQAALSNDVSISDILSTSKARNEITITPVGQFETVSKDKMDEEEAEDSADRLVIDESCEPIDGRNRTDNSSEAGDEVPQCQGCNQKPAQFVCAGCGNQWYCSRKCQVAAWDEHSEVCSG